MEEIGPNLSNLYVEFNQDKRRRIRMSQEREHVHVEVNVKKHLSLSGTAAKKCSDMAV
jgi:hypothetical protein